MHLEYGERATYIRIYQQLIILEQYRYYFLNCSFIGEIWSFVVVLGTASAIDK